MNTIADVVRWIETEEPFSPAFRKKVLGSVRKMKKLPQYDVPLEQIPVDLDAFDKTWGDSPIRTIPRGFKTKQQFSDWRTQTRSALTSFLDIPKHVSLPAPDDDWSQLISDLEDAGVHQKKLISSQCWRTQRGRHPSPRPRYHGLGFSRSSMKRVRQDNMKP